MANLITSIGSLFKSVSTTSGNGVSPIVITTTTNHNLVTGDYVKVASVGGNTAANTTVGTPKQVTVISATQFSIAGTGNGAYTSGGNVSREYNSVQAWVAATTGVAAGNVALGYLYDDDGAGFSIPNFGTQIIVTGATTSSTRYRHLSAAPGNSGFTGLPHRYNPYLNTGVRFVKTLTNSPGQNGIELAEQFARLTGVGMIADTSFSPTSGTSTGILISSANCRLESVYCRWDQGSSSFSGRCFWINLASAQNGNTTLIQCIAQGSGDPNYGAHTGIHNANDNSALIYNCVAYNAAFGATPRGIENLGSGGAVRNCIAVGNAFADFTNSGALFTNNISGDTTATSYDLTGNSYGNKVANQLWQYADFGDFRAVKSSPALNVGVDLSATFTLDFAGGTHHSPWDIGPYDGAPTTGLPITGSPPTEVVKTIGSAGGRDYATIAAWESATRFDLIYDVTNGNTIQVGELYDDSVFSVGSGVTLTGARSDSTRYRTLRAASASRYDPTVNIGARITGNPAAAAVITLSENYARLEGGVFVENTNASSGQDAVCVALAGKGAQVDSVFGRILSGTGTNRSVFTMTTLRSQRIMNSIALGAGNGTSGATFGFLATSDAAEIYNCVGFNLKTSGSLGKAFKTTGSNAVVQNCIGIGSTQADFDLSGTTTADHNCSSDSSASGAGSLTSRTSTAVFFAPTSSDFRLLSTSPCNNAGAQLSSIFSTDFSSSARTAPWEMGAFNGIAYFIGGSTPDVQRGNRFCTCWMIERVDGVVLYFTDHDATLTFNGQTWTPVGGFDATARRSETGMKDDNVEVLGIISSSAITADDFRARKYQGATVTELIVDHRCPYFGAFEVVKRWVVSAEWTSERWNVQLGGLGFRAQQKQGRITARDCGYVVFDPNTCRLAPVNFQVGIAVTGVTSARTTFAASSVTGSAADGYFALGEFTWTSGANANISTHVRNYTQSGRVIELEERMPFDIQVGDKFTMKPGCDGTRTTCISLGNIANFGGEPFSPGTDRAFATPQS